MEANVWRENYLTISCSRLQRLNIVLAFKKRRSLVEEPAEQPVTKCPDEKFCSECGAIIKAKAEICPKCGMRQIAPPSNSPLGQTTPSGKNKLVAGLLALFLGGLGIHKFYLGKGVQGILYLVLCWTFIPAIIGFVEGLNYLLMNEQTFFARYGKS